MRQDLHTLFVSVHEVDRLPEKVSPTTDRIVERVKTGDTSIADLLASASEEERDGVGWRIRHLVALGVFRGYSTEPGWGHDNDGIWYLRNGPIGEGESLLRGLLTPEDLEGFWVERDGKQVPASPAEPLLYQWFATEPLDRYLERVKTEEDARVLRAYYDHAVSGFYWYRFPSTVANGSRQESLADRIHALLKAKGPLTPGQIANQLNANFKQVATRLGNHEGKRFVRRGNVGRSTLWGAL